MFCQLSVHFIRAEWCVKGTPASAQFKSINSMDIIQDSTHSSPVLTMLSGHPAWQSPYPIFAIGIKVDPSPPELQEKVKYRSRRLWPIVSGLYLIVLRPPGGSIQEGVAKGERVFMWLIAHIFMNLFKFLHCTLFSWFERLSPVFHFPWSLFPIMQSRRSFSLSCAYEGIISCHLLNKGTMRHFLGSIEMK